MSPGRPRRLILGNWKMHMTASAAISYARELLPLLPQSDDREVVLAPPFTALPGVGALLADHPHLKLAAQNVAWEDEGPYTGEISGPMLRDLGVEYVLIGHSERRRHMGETDAMVNRKVHAALRSLLRPVVCVGEMEDARQAGRAAEVVSAQVRAALETIPAGSIEGVTLAYEPVWAIGTGRTASPADASQMHAVIRRVLESLFGPVGGSLRILYGGSVTAGNVDPLLARPGVDGALVGGASLQAADFARIARFLPAV